MKKLIIFLMFVVVVGLTSCSKKIPEGDIKDFVEKLDYETAYSFVQNAKSNTTVKHFENGEEDGHLIMDITIDKEDTSYYYSESQVSGYFYGVKEGQYSFRSQKTLCYMNDEESVSVYQTTDNMPDTIQYSPEDVMRSIYNFFYTELEAGIYRGGFYYGDYVRLNCAQFYELFSLNDTKDELTYSINTVTKDKDDTDILNMHSFTINTYGMLVRLSSVAKNNSKKLKVETTTTITYNTDFEKIFEL
ncbi:MAG: hypothetical protein K2J85_01835 [Anaeroplasmataceae bacterium]|nr:hypothetical protein [Anaeroplasmataceae bacterium]